GPRFTPEFDAGEYVVVPNLLGAGVDSIEIAVASHGDTDHAGGLAAVLEAVPISALFSGEPERIGMPSAVQCRAGQTWRLGEATLEVLWPVDVEGLAPNDRSCVVRM